MHPDIQLVCLDLDQTLITHNSWSELNIALGVSTEEDQRLYRAFKQGDITYEEWNDLILEKYLEHADATREGITRALSRYTYTPGAKEAVTYLQKQGYTLVLISGSIDILVDRVAKELGIAYAKANNTFLFNEHDRLYGIHADGDDTFAKASHLQSFCDLLNIPMTACACIGDGLNDQELFTRTGHGITFTGSDITPLAWKTVDSLYDLNEIL